MVNAWMKGAIIGIPLAVLLLGLFYIPVTTLLALLFTIAVFCAVDWSGQGDGREGCNLHTSCDH